MDAVTRITRSEQTAITGVCSGGIIAAMVAAHLAHTGRQDQIAALTLMVTVLDQARAGLGSAVIDERNARLAAAASAARGYLDGRSLAEVSAWKVESGWPGNRARTCPDQHTSRQTGLSRPGLRGSRGEHGEISNWPTPPRIPGERGLTVVRARWEVGCGTAGHPALQGRPELPTVRGTT
jgi:hypothetical protein